MRRLLINVTPVIKALELVTKSALGSELIGSYKSRFKGRGIEFEEYSEYTPEGDAKLIDWKASIRANKLLVKEYTEERSLNIFFLIDVSNSMIYTTGKKLKAEYVGELVISLAFLMIKNADRVGFALFNDRIVKEHVPQGGLIQYYRIIDNLLNAQNYGGKYNFSNALDFVSTYVKPKSMLIIISDFIGLRPGWQDILRREAEKFDIITFMVRDPADRVLPETKRGVVLRDPFSDKKIYLRGEKIRERYESYVRQQEKDIENFFTSLGISFLRLDTSKSFVEPIISFFNERKRIILGKV